MRQVECWECGTPVAAADAEALARALADHLREAHGRSHPDPAAVARWAERSGGDPAVGLGVLTAGRVLAGAAAVTFVFLAFLNPSGIGGTERTIQVMSYLGFAALAGALVCVLTLLKALLQR